MFYGTREGVLEVLATLGAQQCQYSHKEWSSFCDCKFGMPSTGSKGEQTGCPELRTLHEVVSKMTDAEFRQFATRRFKPPEPYDSSVSCSRCGWHDSDGGCNCG